MTITGGSSLPKDEIDRTMKEAKAHAAEDRKRHEDIEVRNGAEQAAYRIEKLLKDNTERFPEDAVVPMREVVKDLRKANEDEDIKTIRAVMSTLEKESQAIGQAFYVSAQNGSAGEEETEAPKLTKNSDGDDDVIDVEVIDKEKDK